MEYKTSGCSRRTSKVSLKQKDELIEYRGKHPKCKFCAHYRYKILDIRRSDEGRTNSGGLGS